MANTAMEIFIKVLKN